MLNALPPSNAQILRLSWESLKNATRYAVSRGAWYTAGSAWRAARLLLSLRKHVAVQKLLSDPQFATLLRKQPLLPIKYSVPYVATGLSTQIRWLIFVAHYQFMRRAFCPAFLDAVLTSLPLWRASIDSRQFVISMDFPYSNQEGDLQLVLKMDGVEVYRLVFVFAPGRAFDMNEDNVIVVSCIQGAPDFDHVKVATKRCCEIQPAHMLMTALDGLAESTRISTLLGFHGSRQLSNGPQLLFSYEAFYANYGEPMAGRQMHRVRLPHLGKQLSDIRSNHRQRAIRKHRFKAEIRAQVRKAVAPYLN